ncbi:universal stress protein, partial [Streptomyces sp. NPDC002143]
MAVILGYDESPGAVRALRVALELSAALAEPLVLVYG